MNRNSLKIVLSKRNFDAANILIERLSRIPPLMLHQIMKYGSSNDKKSSSGRHCGPPKPGPCPPKPSPCPPKPCKLPRYACPPNDPPDHCPYKPPKCKKPCDNKPKPC